jgi:hypothetical protein
LYDLDSDARFSGPTNHIGGPTRRSKVAVEGEDEARAKI